MDINVLLFVNAILQFINALLLSLILSIAIIVICKYRIIITDERIKRLESKETNLIEVGGD